MEKRQSMTVRVRCSGHMHRLELRGDKLVALDHEPHEESSRAVLEALAEGAGACRCFQVIEAWRACSAAYDPKAEAVLPRALVPKARKRALAAAAGDPYEVSIVEAESVGRPRHCPVSVSFYELRLYGRDLCPTRAGPVPRGFPGRVVLARRGSGNGAPQWMVRACDEIVLAGPTTIAEARRIASGAR